MTDNGIQELGPEELGPEELGPEELGPEELGPEEKDMGPIEIIGAGAKGFAKFASRHATLVAVMTLTAVGGTVYVTNNYKSADGTNGGALIKQDVAVKDAKGDLRMEVQGAKTEAPKVNEPAKSGNDEILKKLQETTKDAGIMAEPAKVNEPAVEEAPKPEKPYIPETAYNDTSANLLDGNDSAAFKTVIFASSGSGSTAYEQSKGGQSSGATTSGNASNGSTVKVAKSGGKVEELEGKTSATSASGKAETAKGNNQGGRKTNDPKGGDGSKTETDKEILSDGKTETANSSNNSGETGPETGNVVTPPTTNVDDTVSTVAAPQREEVRSSERPE